MYTMQLAYEALLCAKKKITKRSIPYEQIGFSRVSTQSEQTRLDNTLYIEDKKDFGVICSCQDASIELSDCISLEVSNIILSDMGEYLDWELELTNLVLSDSILEIVEFISQKIEMPVMIVDGNNMMCTMSESDFDCKMEQWHDAKIHGRLSWQMLDLLSKDLVFVSKRQAAQGNPFFVEIAKSGNLIFCDIDLAKISDKQGGASKFFLLIFCDQKSSGYKLLEMSKDASIAIKKWIGFHVEDFNLLNTMNFFVRLAAGEEVSEEEIESQKSDFADSGDTFVLLRIVYGNSLAVSKAAFLFQAKIEKSRCFDIEGKLYALCVDYPDLEKDLNDLASENGFRFGLSWRFSDWRRVHEAVGQTEVALSSSAGSVAILDSYGVMFYIFSILLSSTSNIEIVHPAIDFLAEYDKAHGSEYLLTLWVFLRHERNLVKTATDLNLHRNSLVYRVKKITELLEDVDLDDSETREHLMMSYRLRGLQERSIE